MYHVFNNLVFNISVIKNFLCHIFHTESKIYLWWLFFLSKTILKVILPSTIPPCWQSSSQSNTFWSGWKIKLASELPGDYSVLAIGWKCSPFEKLKFPNKCFLAFAKLLPFPPNTNEMVQAYVIIITSCIYTMLVYLLFKLPWFPGLLLLVPTSSKWWHF